MADLLGDESIMSLWNWPDRTRHDHDTNGGDGFLAVVPIAGRPVYWQCTDRPRSILTLPGKGRGGVAIARLMPGAAFVVTGRTDFWKRGYVPGAPANPEGFVMSEYLSPYRAGAGGNAPIGSEAER